MNEPILMPLRNVVHVDEILATTSAHRIIAADCYVAGAESWTPHSWGWEQTLNGRTIINVDHHADDARFFRNVSSGNLAIEYLKTREVDAKTAVVINHTDCDSVISSAILCGILEPADRYANAVIAADHTGEPDPIADLLQALDPARGFAMSIRNLRLMESCKAIEPSAQRLLDKRHADRDIAERLVKTGAFERIRRVAVATLPLEQRVPGEFLPSLLGDRVWAIISGTPMQGNTNLWEIKIRLGAGAPAGTNLFSMGVQKAEPKFGGRWNAGSTKRAGGSSDAPREVALRLSELLAGYLVPIS
ncbi:MAG TPA: hypothetical protein VGL53_11960 [Bryobacteraceae bacterium]|jgi:hypothetical protein